MTPSPTVSELRALLSSLSLDSRGTKQTLKQRLLKHQSRTRSSSPSSTPTLAPSEERNRPRNQGYDSYLVFDVEATCELIERNPRLAFSYPNEIIEWPVILLQWRRKIGSQVESTRSLAQNELPQGGDNGEEDEEDQDEWELYQVDEFHSFVKPNWNPQLSSFCTELTGIIQEQIDEAPRFQKLLKKFEKDFVKKHELFTKDNKTIWITDGPWDLRDFVAKTCYLSKVPRPDYLAGEIIDLKLLVSHFFTNLKAEKKHSSSPSSSPVSSPSPISPVIDDEREQGATSLLPESSSADNLPNVLLSETPLYQPNSLLLSPPPDLSVPSVLSSLTLPPFQGRLHSGLSDTRNISRIVLELANQRRVELKGNRLVPDGGKGGKERRWGWMGRGGEVKWDSFRGAEERRMERKRVGGLGGGH
ncbi:hypothetical protein JCM5350_001097 [Sporobolomyces pararoseus]